MTCRESGPASSIKKISNTHLTIISGSVKIQKLSPKGADFASVAQLVEQRTENPRVVGSIPTRGTICGRSSFGRAPPCQGGGSEFESRRPLQHFIRRHSQVVRQRTANPRFPSSNLGGASKNKRPVETGRLFQKIDGKFFLWLV